MSITTSFSSTKPQLEFIKIREAKDQLGTINPQLANTTDSKLEEGSKTLNIQLDHTIESSLVSTLKGLCNIVKYRWFRILISKHIL